MLSHQISDTLAKKFLDLSIYLPIYKRARSKFSKTHFINKIAIIISENALRKKTVHSKHIWFAKKVRNCNFSRKI